MSLVLIPNVPHHTESGSEASADLPDIVARFLWPASPDPTEPTRSRDCPKDRRAKGVGHDRAGPIFWTTPDRSVRPPSATSLHRWCPTKTFHHARRSFPSKGAESHSHHPDPSPGNRLSCTLNQFGQGPAAKSIKGEQNPSLRGSDPILQRQPTAIRDGAAAYFGASRSASRNLRSVSRSGSSRATKSGGKAAAIRAISGARAAITSSRNIRPLSVM